MKHVVLIGSLTGILVVGSVLAGAAQDKPATKKAASKSEASSGSPKAPNPQSTTADDKSSTIPSGEVALGSVRVPRKVMADGKTLAAGTYQLRLTGEEAKPVAGESKNYERWVEFLQGGKVVGREVASVVPESEIGVVAKGPRPRKGGSRVEMLRGDDYLRIWVNRGTANVLIHLPPAA